MAWPQSSRAARYPRSKCRYCDDLSRLSVCQYVVIRRDKGTEAAQPLEHRTHRPWWWGKQATWEGRVDRSHAADDFDAIRRRVEELQTERAGTPTPGRGEDPPYGPRPYHVKSGGGHSRRQSDFEATGRGCDGPSPPMSLRAACKLVGYDRAGVRCTNCSLAARCLDDSRWLIRERGRLV